MDDFNTIRLKKKTIEKFKEYSKKVSPNYSETLDFMIAFFEDNYLSPYDILNSPMWSFNKIINKRMDAVVAIIRNMEKTQLIPSREMLETLFDEADKEDEEPLYIERTQEEIEASKTETEKLIDLYHNQYKESREQLVETRKYLIQILDDLTYVKSTFSKDYYRLDVSKEKMEELKSKF